MARFCTTCGTPLANEIARFCTKCGTAVAAPPNSVTAASPSVSGSVGSTRSDKTLPPGSPKPIVAGILAGLFPFGVGAVYVCQYAKGWMYTVVSVALIFGMSQRFPVGVICGILYVFYYVWQIIDTVRGAKAIRSAAVITDISTMKRATTIAAMFLIVVSINIVISSMISQSTKANAAIADGVAASLQPTSKQPSYKPSHLTFRGLHAGQSQAEVEATLKRLDGNASLECEKPNEDGAVFCEMHDMLRSVVKGVGFSRDGRLFHFMFETWNDSQTGTDSDDFFAPLRKDLADSNHEDGAPQATGGGVIGDYLARNGVQHFTWRTDRTVVCPDDQERDDCPSEEIDLTEYHGNGMPNATIEFKDNAYYSDGMVKKDKNRPKPKVEHAITFLGLYGGESRPRVEAGLRKLGYSRLSCKYSSKDVLVECSTASASHKIDLIDFVHGQLSAFRFHYPASEHDELYQQFVKELGDPTDFTGRKGSETFTWETESTGPCPANSENQCPDTGLILSTATGENEGIILFNYTSLIKINIEERAEQMVRAAHHY